MNLSKIFKNKNDKFYRWFEQAAENNYEAARLLHKHLLDFKDPKKVADKIHSLEHDGDEICHKIFDEVNRSFMTPIDREDITSLTQRIDDVIDLIHASADSLEIYNVKKPTKYAIRLSEVITESTKSINDIMPKLRHRRTFPAVAKAVIEINRLENEADEILRDAIRDLFSKNKNALDLICWSNIYETMEEVTDKCEDIANVLRGLTTKYA